MKRSTFFLAVPAVLLLSSGFAFAQHGHGAGGPMMGAGPHGDAAHDNGSASAGAGGHAASPTMASTNPGGVLDHNTNLAAKLEGLLNLGTGPAALTALKNDTNGFKNFGQFVAAVHAHHNLDIPFADLQAKMTGPNRVSLGKAIQELKPDADAKAEAKKATTQANDDVNETS